MSYWDDRQDQLKNSLEKDEENLRKRLSNYYTTESRKLENQIASYYSRYGENNVIEYRKMMEKLDDDDMKLLMEQMNEFGNKYPEHAHLLPIRESIYRLNRMEGLQTSIRMQQLEIGAINNRELEKHLTKNAHRCINSAAESMGFGKSFYSVDSEIVKNIVNAKWSRGKNFSDDIWENTDKLSNYLNTDISQALSRGDSYERIRKNMKERFDKVSRRDMYRLIYTEGTYVMAEASMKPFEDDIENYGIVTAGDGGVCSTCKDMAKQTFDVKDRKPEANFPPFHPWCRCTFRLIVEDWDKWMDDYESKHGLKAKLGSGNSNTNLNSSGKYVETINMKHIDKYIKKYENEIKDYPVEHAYIIQGNGKVLHYVGGKANVTFDDATLKGATVLHNHPVILEEPSNCFQEDDFAFLQNYGLQIKKLRATYGDIRYEAKVLKDMSEVSYSEFKMKSSENIDIFSEFVDFGEYVYELLAKEGYITYAKTKAK